VGVTWRNPWTRKKHTKGFDSEGLAISFENALLDIAAKEKQLLRKRHKKKYIYSNITVREVLESYMRMAYTNKITIRQTQYHAVQILTAFWNRQAIRITKHDILQFSEAQHLRGIAQITINRRVSILRAALNWAVRNDIIKENPLRDLRMPHVLAQRIAPPTVKEAQAILAVAAPHVQRVVILGLCAGPRIGPSELFRLEWDNVDLANAMIRMPCAQKSALEDGRDIPIRMSLLPIMQQWLQHDQKFGIRHVISWAGRPVRCIAHAWHAALKRAGISRRIRPYDLRHGFAIYSLAGSADIGSVARLMGHVDASMILQTYQHVLDTQKRAAVEAATDILRLEDIGMKTVPGI